MFKLNVTLALPRWLTWKGDFKRVSCHGHLSKNKLWEAEVAFYSVEAPRLGFTIDLFFTGRDHAGPKLIIDLLWANFVLGVTDCRHWDYKLNRWEEYPTENGM